MSEAKRTFRWYFWARVVSMLLLSNGLERFDLKEIRPGRSGFEEAKEVRIAIRLYLKSTVEEADVYYTNKNGISEIDVWEMPCNEKGNGEEMAESLKKQLEPFKSEIDSIFRIFLM